jgi:hypothetical protein
MLSGATSRSRASGTVPGALARHPTSYAVRSHYGDPQMLLPAVALIKSIARDGNFVVAEANYRRCRVDQREVSPVRPRHHRVLVQCRYAPYSSGYLNCQ